MVRGLGVATLAVIALPSAAAGAPIDVNTTADALNANDGRCTLREAARSANLDTASGPAAGECRAGAGADAIRVPTGNFTLSLTGANENAAATGDLDLTGTVDVTGAGTTPGPTGTTLNGMADRVFDVQAGATVTISALQIFNGDPPDGNSGLDAEAVPVGGSATGGPGLPGSDGGGLLNAGSLTLAGVVVSHNAAGNGGAGGSGKGADGADVTGGDAGAGTGGAGGPAGNGGAIHSTGTLVIRDSTITTNFGGTAPSGGVGIGGEGGTGAPGGTGGTAVGGNGQAGGIGGISVAAGTLTMSGTTVTNNVGGRGGDGGATQNGRGGDGTAPNGTGGDGATNKSGKGGAGGAGGIAGAGAITVTTSAIAANEAGDGGDSQSSFTGSGGTHMGTGADGFGGSALGQTGGSGGAGGGINASGALSITRSLVAGNTAGKGGKGGSATSAGAAPKSGTAVGGAGAPGGFGGGILATSGAPVVSNVTFDANSAGAAGTGGTASTFQNIAIGGPGGNGGSGGNVSITGGSSFHVTMTAGAVGAGAVGGGAISFGGPATLLTTGALGSAGAGAGLAAGGGTTVGNSIFSGTGCTGTITDALHNITFNATGCPGANTDPKLGPLADNGGPSQTRRLLAGSSALDFVPSTGANCTPLDQRGAVRPFGTACDAGAFELAPPAVATGAASGIAASTANVAGTVTPRGLTATYRVEFGETTAYGQSAAGGTSASATPAGVTVALAGLRAGTTYHYRFLAQSPDGSATGADATFKTLAAPPPAARPVLSALTVKPARFRIAAGATKVRAAAKRKKAVPKGTTISFRLSRAATAKLAMQRPGNGVKVKRRGKTVCVAATKARFRRAPKRSRCTIYRTKGTLTRSGKAGLNRVRFTGRIGRRALALGRYRMLATAQSGTLRSLSRSKTFSIVKR